MPDGHIHEQDSRSAAERLLEDSWGARERRASQRELVVETVSAALFALAALAFAFACGHHTAVDPGTAALLVAVYAAVARIEFPVGAGSVVPTQLVLVPMLVLLPAATVPVAVALGLVLSAVVDFSLGRVPRRRVLTSVSDAWHAFGPAAVLALAGSPAIGFDQLPLVAAALAVGCFVDLATSVTRVRLAGVVVDLRAQLRVMGLVSMVDVTLAPVGFLAALTAQRVHAAVVLVLPLVFLLWLLARDRNQRIDQAHRRLKLVEQERVRLQSAVRRLGDAFAAKLDLHGLLEILLHGSLEALDADAGCIRMRAAAPHDLIAGHHDRGRELLEGLSLSGPVPDRAVQAQQGDIWTVTVPMRVGTGAQAESSLHFIRDGRAFEDDEITLIAELVGKAELAAAEILTHHTIREQAMTDALTGLGNRRQLAADLAQTLAGDSGGPSLLLLFDLDGFKTYNDTFGHLAGDALLVRLGQKLQEAVAGRGCAYRLGGDEFCAHLHVSGAEESQPVISRAAAALSERGSEFSVRASIGVVVLPHEADSPDHALALADERMYVDKRSQTNGARNQAREVLLRTMHAKAPDLDEHSGNVALLASRVARELGLVGEAVDEIVRAAELHDVGKVGIPDAILNKPSALSSEEWTFMHQHTILGERILHGAPALRPVARLVRSSHERWDGLGYPDGLQGEEIPLGSRIVAVCDAYEAMTVSRPYHRALSHRAACDELRRASGTQFDPRVVDVFLEVINSEWRHDEPDSAEHAAIHVRTLLQRVQGTAPTVA